MKPNTKTTTATTTAKTSANYMQVGAFCDLLCMIAELQKKDNILKCKSDNEAIDNEAEEAFENLYKAQIEEIKSGKVLKLLDFVNVLDGDFVNMSNVLTAVQTFRLLPKVWNFDAGYDVSFNSNFQVTFTVLEMLQHQIRKNLKKQGGAVC